MHDTQAQVRQFAQPRLVPEPGVLSVQASSEAMNMLVRRQRKSLKVPMAEAFNDALKKHGKTPARELGEAVLTHEGNMLRVRPRRENARLVQLG